MSAPRAAPVRAADLAGLAARLGAGAVLDTSAEGRRRASADRSGGPAGAGPAAVVRAATAADVVRTLRWATEHTVPVVPRGAGTGLAGGAAAGPGSVALDLAGLDRIVGIRPEDGLAVVEAGVVTADLDRAARRHGLRYAPDPASVELSTIGGNIATNAGGLRCVKYGVTGDAVLGLDVVLADGTRLRTGRDTVKGVAGYDLTSLLVGSEGTLAVVVGATLRLVPVPAATGTAAAYFRTAGEAADACSAVLAAGLRPSVLELLDGATLGALDAAHGTGLRGRGEALVIAQADGFAALDEIGAVGAVLRSTAAAVEVAGDQSEADRLLAARRAALPAVERLGPVLIEDIAVPRSRLAEAFAGIAAISARTGVPVFTFAHAGDGNLHPLVSAGGRRVPKAVDAVFRLALDLGGTVTGEHGVGTLKRHWLHRELPAGLRDVQQRVKDALDPLGILNPGKAL